MGEASSLTARDRAIAQVRDRYPDCSSLGIGWMLDAVDADTLQDLHDERRMLDIEASIAESSRDLIDEAEAARRRDAAIRVAAEGPGGDPFGGFPQ